MNTSLRLYFASAALLLLSAHCLPTVTSAQDQGTSSAGSGVDGDPASREDPEAFLKFYELPQREQLLLEKHPTALLRSPDHTLVWNLAQLGMRNYRNSIDFIFE